MMFTDHAAGRTGRVSVTLRAGLFCCTLCLACQGACEQVLAMVGTTAITDTRLASALASAPFATRFPSLDEDQQAALRGDMLIRLVDAEILRQEARALGLDREADFRREVADYRNGLLYRHYIQDLRNSITLPESVDLDLKQRYRDNPDALAAARSSYIAKRFKPMKEERLQELEQRYQVRIYSERLNPPPTGDTVLAEGDFFTVRQADMQAARDRTTAAQTPEQGAERLHDIVETTIAARAALENGIDVEQQVESYRNDLLPQALIEKKAREWIPDDTVLRDYYQQHPGLGHSPERRHIGQLVLETRAEAESMRRRILAGESLFVLAGEASIDPVGRAQAGDMGWLNEGSGFPAIEAALQELGDGEVSDIIETPRGFHLVTIIDRRPGRQRPLPEIRDQVRQAIISARLGTYLERLAERYPVRWMVPVRGQDD